MKTPTIISLAAVLCLLLFAAAPLRATDATYNNLTITGTGDFQSASTVFGTWSEGGGIGGLTLNYADGTTPAINFIGSGTSSVWQWWQYNGSANLLSMKLDQNNQVIIYTSGTGGTAGITLNPAGTSTFAGSVTISGTDNELPNQVLVSGSSILTEGLGDARYLALSASSSFFSGTNIVVGTGTNQYGSAVLSFGFAGSIATGPGSFAVAYGTASGTHSIAEGYASHATALNSVAIGYQSIASGEYATASGIGSTASGAGSVASGENSIASGVQSVAMGFQSTASGNSSSASGNQSTASGDFSVAPGFDSTASGYGSTAIGTESISSNDFTISGAYAAVASEYCSTANGIYSTASGPYANGGGLYSTANGWYATASGPYSTASGYDATAAGACTNATGYGQFVIGQWNSTQGDPNNWVATDNLFIVGNGLGSGTTSNAFVVAKNGDTAVSGALTVSGTSGNLNTIANGGLAVTGTSVGVVVGSGTVTTVVSTGSNNLLLAPQQGDISMGVFVNGVQPPH